MTQMHDPLVGLCFAFDLPDAPLPGADPTAPQAASALAPVIVAALARILGAQAEAAPALPAFLGEALVSAFVEPAAAPIDAVALDADDPEERAYAAAEGIQAFVDLLDDPETASLLSQTAVGEDGVRVLRSPAAVGVRVAELRTVLALEVPEGWRAVTLADARGRGVVVADARTHGHEGLVVASLELGQSIAAVDVASGRFSLLRRASSGVLQARVGVWRPEALLAAGAGSVAQPAWLEALLSDAARGWLASVDALGARLRGGNDLASGTIEELIAREDALRASVVDTLPPLARAALDTEVHALAAGIAADSLRVLPRTEALARDDDAMDPDLWAGDALTSEGERLLLGALEARERAESLLACLAMTGGVTGARMALRDADVWLRRAVAVVGVPTARGAEAARLVAVGTVDADAWWTARGRT